MILADTVFLISFWTLSIYIFVKQIQNIDNLFLNVLEHSVFYILTAGIIGFLLFFKCYYGLKFIWFSTEGYKMRAWRRYIAKQRKLKKMPENTKLTKREDTIIKKLSDINIVKIQRKELNSFFVLSSIFYIFLILISACMIPVALALSQIDKEFKP